MKCRKGWYFEPYRHSLAAKGISSKRYNFEIFKKSDRKKIFDDFKSPEEKTQIGQDRKLRLIHEVENDLHLRLQKMENKREMTFEDSNRFFTHEFAPLAKKFEKGQISADQFMSEAKGSFDYFTSKNQKTLRPFAWTKDAEQEQGTGFFNWRKSGPGLFDFEGRARQDG